MDPFPLLILVASSVGWWRVAEREDESKVNWLGLSLALNFAALILFGTLSAMVAGQVPMFVGIAAWRVWREARDG